MAAKGTLSVVSPGANGTFETFIRITSDGSVSAYNGHVDLGTGIRTALGQIVAEELDVSFARVVVVLGDTAEVPNQGATIASETIQITAVPLRNAAAQARLFLIARAAERLELPVDDLTIEDGLVRGKDNRSVSYGELISDEEIRLELTEDVAVKDVSAYSIVGQSVPRVDLPAKATGELVYVHDVRVPGMLHGRVVRPPYAGVDAGAFVGTSLIAVDEASVRHIPGLVAVIRIVMSMPRLRPPQNRCSGRISGRIRCTPRSDPAARSPITATDASGCGPARKIHTSCAPTLRC
jgi:nicotinate dehydrogenase subunit B